MNVTVTKKALRTVKSATKATGLMNVEPAGKALLFHRQKILTLIYLSYCHIVHGIEKVYSMMFDTECIMHCKSISIAH